MKISSRKKLEERIVELESEILKYKQYQKIDAGGFASLPDDDNVMGMLSGIIFNSPDIRIFWKDTNLIYQGCNDNFLSDANLNESNDLIGKSDFELIWKNSAKVFKAQEQEIIELGIPQEANNEAVHSDSVISWRRITRMPLKNDGKIVGIIGYYYDVSKEIRLKEKYNILNARITVQEQKIKLQDLNVKEISKKSEFTETELRKTNRKLLLAKEALKQRKSKYQEVENLLLNPSETNNAINQLIESRQFDELHGNFAELHQVSSVILDTKGNQISKPVNLGSQCKNNKEACAFYQQINWEQNALSNIYKFGSCTSCGLTYAAVPIYLGKTIIGNWIFGQVLLKENIKEGQAIPENVIVYSKKKFTQIAEYAFRIASDLTEKWIYQLKLNHYLNEQLTTNETQEYNDNKLRAVLNTSPDIIMILDIEGKISEVFTAKDDSLVLQQIESKNQSLYEAISKDSALKFREAIEEVIETGATQSFEYSVEQNHQKLWYSVSASRVEIDGQFQVVTISKEVTEVVKSREELIQSEAQKRAIINNVPHLAWLKDTHGKFLSVNNTYSKICGYPQSRIVGKTDFDLWPEQQAERYRLNDQEIIRTKEKSIYEEYIVLPNGIRWFETFKAPIFNKNREVIGITGISRDITEKKQALENLKESEELYRQLISASPDGIIMANLSGRITFASPKVITMFGLTDTTEIIDTNLGNWVTDANAFTKNLELLLVKQTCFNYQYQFKTRYSDTFFGEMSCSIIKDYEDKPRGFISVVRDISERKKTEEELLLAKLKAEESDQLKSAFLANMSHEIRTPMNGILGFVNLLADPDLSQDERKEFIRIIHSNSSNLLRIIDDIIDVAKLEAGELKVSFAPCLINDILQEIQRTKISVVNDLNKDVEIHLNIPEQLEDICITTDKNRLNQIVNNLVSNAIKFTYHGYIEIGYDMNEHEVIFYVRDTGVGIQENQLQLIFERFRQADDSRTRQYGGTGLGLTITKNMVELLGGKIWVESVLNKGTTFFFTIPKKIAEVDSYNNVRNVSFEIKKQLKNFTNRQ